MNMFNKDWDVPPTYNEAMIDIVRHLQPDQEVPNHEFSQIINGLFLTDCNYTLKDVTNNNILLVINVTTDCPPDEDIIRDVDHLQFFYEDSVHETLPINYLSNLIYYAVLRSEENPGIIVHCYAGVSRSSTIIIAYLMKYKHLSLEDAYEFVLSKRKFVNINLGFFSQLIRFELLLYSKQGYRKPNFLRNVLVDRHFKFLTNGT